MKRNEHFFIRTSTARLSHRTGQRCPCASLLHHPVMHGLGSCADLDPGHRVSQPLTCGPSGGHAIFLVSACASSTVGRSRWTPNLAQDYRPAARTMCRLIVPTALYDTITSLTSGQRHGCFPFWTDSKHCPLASLARQPPANEAAPPSRSMSPNTVVRLPLPLPSLPACKVPKPGKAHPS